MTWKLPSGISERDFRLMIKIDFGRSISFYSWDATNENAEDPITGDENYATGQYAAASTITAVFCPVHPSYMQNFKIIKEGLLEDSDAYLMTLYSQSIKRNDKISFTEDSKVYTYRVGKVYDLMSIAKYCSLYLITRA